MNNTKKLPTTGIKPAIESFFAISVCHFCNQSGCKGIIFIDYSYSIEHLWFCRYVVPSIVLGFYEGYDLADVLSHVTA